MIGTRPRSLSLQVGLLSALVAVAACGGAAPEAAAPSSTPAPEAKAPDARSDEPSTVEQAQDQIAAAKAELAAAGDASDASRFAPEPPSATGSAARPATEPSQSPSAASPPRSTRPSKAESPKAAPSCGSPCRALASMRRAVTALCRMTGGDDTRCVDAKRTLRDAEGRIAPCAC